MFHQTEPNSRRFDSETISKRLPTADIEVASYLKLAFCGIVGPQNFRNEGGLRLARLELIDEHAD